MSVPSWRRVSREQQLDLSAVELELVDPNDTGEEVRGEDDLFTGENIETVPERSGEFQFPCYGQARPLVVSERADATNGFSTCTRPHCPQDSCTIHNHIHGHSWTAISKCLAMRTLLDATPKKIHSGRCCDVEWPIRESVVQKYGSPALEQRRVRIGGGGEGSNRRYGTAVDFERLLFV